MKRVERIEQLAVGGKILVSRRGCRFALALLATAVPPLVALGQTIDTTTARQLGSQTGSSLNPNVYNSITAGNQATIVPGYNSHPSQTSYFQNGQGALAGPGAARVSNCASQSDVECQAVNLMKQGPQTRPQFTITRSDPLLGRSRTLTTNPSGQLGDIFSTYQTCTTTTKTVPPIFQTQVCDEFVVNNTNTCTMGQDVVVDPDYLYSCVETIQTQSNETCTVGQVVEVSAQYDFQCQQTQKAYENLSCTRNLVPTCAYGGASISSTSTTQSGLFPTLSISPTSTPGLYTYVFDRPFRVCGTDGWGEIDFNLDTVGQGGYVTINVSNLDDAAAVAVNGYTVFAGYPNNGPEYSGSYFSLDTPAYQVGYQWTEAAGTTCISSHVDGDGTTVCDAWGPVTQTYYANTKLLDHCPAGYSPTSQMAFQTCSADTGTCTPPSTYTPNNIGGFFCNSEGKFLMNRHEGSGTWSGTVSAEMPIKVGNNKIQVYWGTGSWGDACGNVTVSGQIYNVGPVCTSPWDGGCAALEARQ